MGAIKSCSLSKYLHNNHSTSISETTKTKRKKFMLDLKKSKWFNYRTKLNKIPMISVVNMKVFCFQDEIKLIETGTSSFNSYSASSS